MSRRPSVRNLSRPILDPALGPWAYEWPLYFSTPESPYNGGMSASAEDDLLPLPKEWIGKKLIRTGRKPAEVINTGVITPRQAIGYVFQDSIRGRYVIVGPSEKTNDYITGRLTIYVNSDDIIENVMYG